jgi:hypothetical protein
MEDGLLDGLFLGSGRPAADNMEQSIITDVTYGVVHDTYCPLINERR